MKSNVKYDLSGKVALITGAGSGIGRAVALVLAESGCDVFLVDINPNTVVETVQECQKYHRRAIGVKGDVRSSESMNDAAARCISELGRLDICVANAGIGRVGTVQSMSEADFDLVMNVNVKGAFLTVKSCAREMIKQNQGGRVIVVNSANAVIASRASFAYCGSKAATKMMTRCWAQDLIPYHITVNCIGPGATETPLMLAQIDTEEARSGLLTAIPIGRMAHPSEIAWTVAFYCTQAADYLTGTYLLIDGGLRDHNVADTKNINHIRQARLQKSGDSLLEDADQEMNQLTQEMLQQRVKFGIQ